MPELLSLLTLVVCFIGIAVFAKYFGESGLYVYSSVSIIAANIQVLKLTKYAFWNEPVALGTVLFATTFAVDNILTEHYGAASAKRNVWIGFVSYLFFVIVMLIAIQHPTVQYEEDCANLASELAALFTPGVRILLASVISYLVSQLLDVHIFVQLRSLLDGRYLAFRTCVSMAISSFIDNFVFSLLAWVILAENPVSWSVLSTTYIVPSYLLRLSIVMLCVPFVRCINSLIIGRSNV